MCVLKNFESIEKSNFGDVIEFDVTPSCEGVYWEKYSRNLEYLGEYGYFFDSACIYHILSILNTIHIYDDVRVFSDIVFYSKLLFYYKAEKHYNFQVSFSTYINNCVCIYGNYQFYSCVEIIKSSKLYGNVLVCSDEKIRGNRKIYNCSEIRDYEEYRSSKEVCIRSSILLAIKEVRKNDSLGAFVKFIASLVVFRTIGVFVFFVNKDDMSNWY